MSTTGTLYHQFGRPIYRCSTPNFHYHDFPITSSSDELVGKIRGNYRLVANFWPSLQGSHGEIGLTGPSRHVKMVCRVGRQVSNKSCCVVVMEIGERHVTTDFLGQASTSTQQSHFCGRQKSFQMWLKILLLVDEFLYCDWLKWLFFTKWRLIQWRKMLNYSIYEEQTPLWNLADKSYWK